MSLLCDILAGILISAAIIGLCLCGLRLSLGGSPCTPEGNDGNDQGNPGNEVAGPEVAKPLTSLKLHLRLCPLTRVHVLVNSYSELRIRLFDQRTVALLKDQAPKMPLKELADAMEAWARHARERSNDVDVVKPVASPSTDPRA